MLIDSITKYYIFNSILTHEYLTFRAIGGKTRL